LLVAAALAGSLALVAAGGAGADELDSGVNVWVGLKNSDDVGTTFDLKAVVADTADGSEAEVLPNFYGGSSGFNNAHLAAIPMHIADPFHFPQEGTLTLSVRVSCSSKHTSGTARLWWNDQYADSNVFRLYYLTGTSDIKADGAGPGPKMTRDVFVKKNGCGAGGDGGTWQPFGTWGPFHFT